VIPYGAPMFRRPSRASTAAALVLAAASLGGCRRLLHRTTGGDAALTSSFPSPNGLLTAHYPADFSAHAVGKNGVVVQRLLDRELVTLVPVAGVTAGAAADVTAKVLAAEAGSLRHFRETSRRTGTCFGDVSGTEREGSWDPLVGSTVHRWECAFGKGGNFYVLSYDVPEDQRGDEPLLRRILAATELR
jgi:hypothetical protein